MEMYCLWFWRLEVQDQGVGRAMHSLKTCEGEFFLVSP